MRCKAARGARCSSARCGEGTYEVRIEEVLSDDCRCAVDYYANLDQSYGDRFVNTVVRTGHLGYHHTSRNHHLLDIGRRNIYQGLCPIAADCHISNGHPRDDNRRLVVNGLMTVDARHPYYGRMDDHRGMSGCYEARSTGLGRLWFD